MCSVAEKRARQPCPTPPENLEASACPTRTRGSAHGQHAPTPQGVRTSACRARRVCPAVQAFRVCPVPGRSPRQDLGLAGGLQVLRLLGRIDPHRAQRVIFLLRLHHHGRLRRVIPTRGIRLANHFVTHDTPHNPDTRAGRRVRPGRLTVSYVITGAPATAPAPDAPPTNTHSSFAAMKTADIWATVENVSTSLAAPPPPRPEVV